MDKNRLIMEFGCDARNEAVARVVVAAMLTRTNPTLSEVEDVKTAVSEAVTNSIIHGYKACRYCGKTVSAGGLVYILPSGEVYHGKQDCSSLAYYVQKVRRSEVEYMGVCSYCGSG